MIDLKRFQETPLERDPFPYVVVPRFIDASVVDRVEQDFPAVPKGGSFPPSELETGSAFDALVAELEGDALRESVSSKFGIDLHGRPTLTTVRGHARRKDGRIHIDAKWKLVTLLLYMNRDWTASGGNLRLLRSPGSLDDCFADIAPEMGTAVFFRCTDNAWHGHSPYVGERRAIQLNWVESERWLKRERERHRLSSRIKSLFAPAGSRGGARA